MYLPIIVIFVFYALIFIPIHSESTIPNNGISSTYHDSEISLTFNDDLASGTIENNDKIISFDNIKVIDRHDRFYIFDKENNLRIYSKQISDTKYLVLVKISPDVKLRFLQSVDEPRKILGQRNLFEAMNQIQQESKELTWKEWQLLAKDNLIESALKQHELNIKNMIEDGYNKDFRDLTKESILEHYRNYKTVADTSQSTITSQTDNTQDQSDIVISENQIQLFLFVPYSVQLERELRYSVLVTDNTKPQYNSIYKSIISNPIEDVTITGKIINPSNEIIHRFNGETDSTGIFNGKFVISYPSTTIGEYIIKVNAVKTFNDKTVSEYNTSKIFTTYPSDEYDNKSPVANAGFDQHDITGSFVELDGSASFDKESSIPLYEWTQINGTRITLSDSTIVNPIFRIPDVVDSFDFDLRVYDGAKWSFLSDDVTISSLHSSAGANQPHHVNLNSIMISLDGSESGDELGHMINYLWTVLNNLVPTDSTINTESLSDNTIVRPQFTPDRVGNYTFQLVVDDGQHGLRDISNVTVGVTSLLSNAGVNEIYVNNTDGFIINSTEIILDGSKSSDGLGHMINYLWTVLNNLVPTDSTINTESLSDNTIVRPQFTPDRVGNYTFQLAVDDGQHGLRDISNVTITVKPTSP